MSGCGGRTAMKWTQGKADFMIALIAMAWGSSYLLMKIGLNSIPPFSLIALRFGIAFVLVCSLFRGRMRSVTKKTLLRGTVLGSILFSVFGFLLYGLKTTPASTAGFLTSMAVVFVPVLQALVKRKRIAGITLLSVIIAVTGIALMTITESLQFGSGSLLCIGGAFMYAVQIIVTDRFTQESDGLQLGILQLGTASILGAACSFIFETPALPADGAQWGAVLGLAVICSAFGFVMQPVAQKYTTPEHTGLLFSLEPVFSAVFALLFLHEVLLPRNYLGAALVLTGVIISSAFERGQ